MSSRLLLIEDDARAASELCAALTTQGYEVAVAADGITGLERALADSPDVIVADRMLPALDGLAVIQRLRTAGRRTPVLVLSALGTVDDRVAGLRAGGDDYLTKPFAMVELVARIEALLRRPTEGSPTVLRVGDLELDLLERIARRGGRRLDLTARELKLLECLMRHAGQAVTRQMLLEEVWDLHFDPQTNLIDVHVSRLRQTVDKGHEHPLIHTVRGVGYTLRESADG